MITEGKFQIGKNGLTQGVIDSLNLSLKAHNQIRVSLLKTATRDKNKIIEIAEEIILKAIYKCRYKIIGYTIILRKQSKKIKKNKISH